MLSAPSLRCPHRNFKDFVVHCQSCCFLCHCCVVKHLNEHTKCKHAICEDVVETGVITVEILVKDQGRWKMWNLAFSSSVIYAKFMEELEGKIKIVNIFAGKSDAAVIFCPLIKFDVCAEIAIGEVELSKEANARFLAAWIRSQKHLIRFSLHRTKLLHGAFSYLPPAVLSHRLREFSLSDVLFPEGGLGELLRRVLNQGSIERLSLGYIKFGQTDLQTLTQIRLQTSLKFLDFSYLSFLPNTSLSSFTEKLATVSTVQIYTHSCSSLRVIAFSLPALKRLRELRITCEKKEELSFLSLVLPALPHLRECLFNGEMVQTISALEGWGRSKKAYF